MSTHVTTSSSEIRETADAPNRYRRSRGPRRPVWQTALFMVGIIGIIAIFFVPLYWLFSSAFKPQDAIYTWPLTWIPTELTLKNFAEAWSTAPFDRFYLNSIITTLVGTGLEILLAILCAYAFAFVEFRFKKIVFVLIIASMMLPGHVTLIVNYITVANLGWLNTYQGLILPGIASAFAMFLLLQHMRTLPIGLLFLRSQEGYSNWGAIMAGTVFVSLPMLVLFFLGQKRIIGGLAAGALK